MTPDIEQEFAAAGLLDGLGGGPRAARLALLRQLHDDGVPLDELKRAVEDNRLAFLPVDRALSDEPRYSLREVARLANVPIDFLVLVRSAAGMAVPDPDQRALGEHDLESARIGGVLRSGGIPDEGLAEITRVIGRGMSQAAEVIRSVAERTFIEPGVSEHELALRNANAAQAMMPELGPLLETFLRSHLRDQVRQQAITAEELAEGGVGMTRQVFVAFADMVGFTRLGERIGAVTLGELAGRLASMAQEASTGEARLVKTVGDAAMFVGPDAATVVGSVLTLVGRAAETGDFPPLRAGVAGGTAITREGDWYGSPVNLASRVTGVARPASVLGTQEARDAARDSFHWSPAGAHRLKGFQQPVRLYRARRRNGAGGQGTKTP